MLWASMVGGASYALMLDVPAVYFRWNGVGNLVNVLCDDRQ
jgi:hypothetical protein